MHITTRKLAAAAVTGAAYAALTMLLAPISYGAIQCRVSEVLCILPFFIPCTAWGLFAGCAIANLLSAAGIFDVVFGSLATLLAALCTAWLGRGRGAQSWVRCILAALMPVVFNFVFVGAVLTWSLTDAVFPHLNASFWVFGGQVALGEIVVLGVLFVIAYFGFPTLFSLQKLNLQSALILIVFGLLSWPVMKAFCRLNDHMRAKFEAWRAGKTAKAA